MKPLRMYSQFFEEMLGREELVKFVISNNINQKWKENESSRND